MKKVVRRSLSQISLEHLQSRQARIGAETDDDGRRAKAQSLWDSKSKSRTGEEAFTEVLEVLQGMCNGTRRCMYCEDNEATDIEHIQPRSKYPDRTFVWENYLLSCPTCNSRFKGGQYHEGFMDPSIPNYELWARWLFDPGTGHYFPQNESDEGAAKTLEILGFDRREILATRRRTHLTTLVVGIREYAKVKARGQEAQARKIARTFSQLFPALVEWVLTQDPAPELFPDIIIVRKVKKRFPEILRDALE